MTDTATKFTARFVGGPADGNVRNLQADTTDDPKEQGKPPVLVQVAAVKDGTLQMENYLRRIEKTGAVWEYLYAPAKES